MAIKSKEKIFTSGNIILAIIIIILIGSLFFDFFKGTKEEVVAGCPQAIPNLIVTNVIYSGDGTIYTADRLTKPKIDNNVEYKISALFRNIGKDNITINSLLLTTDNLGVGDVLNIEPLTILGNEIKKVEITIPGGDYHKIDAYTNACNGIVLFHEHGEGSVYESEYEDLGTETNTTTNV